MAGERILVVDDGRENREFVVEYILRPNGYRALVARDGREGLEMALAEQPDLILLDLQMPRMTGVQVLHALARENANIPIVLMTFHGSEEIAIEVFRLGVKDYVKKPYTVDEMLYVIERSLSETRLRQEKDALTARLLSSNRELHQRIKELNVLYTMGKSVTAHLELEALAVRVVEAATYVTGAEEGSVLLFEEGELMCHAAKRRTDAHAHSLLVKSTDRLAYRVVEEKELILLSPDDLAAARAKNSNVPYAVLYAPIIAGDRVLGVLGVNNVATDSKVFTEHEGALLSALADYVAIAVDNADAYAQLAQAKK
ncbi:response regulator [Chloroflexota bacterium]